MCIVYCICVWVFLSLSNHRKESYNVECVAAPPTLARGSITELPLCGMLIYPSCAQRTAWDRQTPALCQEVLELADNSTASTSDTLPRSSITHSLSLTGILHLLSLQSSCVTFSLYCIITPVHLHPLSWHVKLLRHILMKIIILSGSFLPGGKNGTEEYDHWMLTQYNTVHFYSEQWSRWSIFWLLLIKCQIMCPLCLSWSL